jgi:hypothetical protein
MHAAAIGLAAHRDETARRRATRPAPMAVPAGRPTRHSTGTAPDPTVQPDGLSARAATAPAQGTRRGTFHAARKGRRDHNVRKGRRDHNARKGRRDHNARKGRRGRSALKGRRGRNALKGRKAGMARTARKGRKGHTVRKDRKTHGACKARADRDKPIPAPGASAATATVPGAHRPGRHRNVDPAVHPPAATVRRRAEGLRHRPRAGPCVGRRLRRRHPAPRPPACCRPAASGCRSC